MADPAPAAPAPTSSPASSDADVFAKFTAQHQAAVANEVSHADPSKNASGRAAPVAARAAGAAPAGATGAAPGGEDAGAERDDGGQADDAGAAPGEGKADGAPAGALSETDAIALLRKSRDDGDTDGIDRALKVLLPGSKGLGEFNVDGKRYGELRTVTKRVQKKLDERAAQLDTREHNLQRGMGVLEQTVARLQPIEQLVIAAQDDSPEGVAKFVELIEKATKKPLNETLKRHLNHKLDKPGDPEVEALKRELKTERETRLERERKEAEARQQQAQRDEIQRHLVFLDETLSKHEDQRVRALVKTQEGMREIFLAQKAHYNPQTRTTLSAEQAAQFVIQQAQKRLEPWQQVLGARSAPAAEPATPAVGKQEAIAPAPTDRARPLGSRGAAPASGGGGRTLSDAELFEKYERLAKVAG